LAEHDSLLKTYFAEPLARFMSSEGECNWQDSRLENVNLRKGAAWRAAAASDAVDRVELRASKYVDMLKRCPEAEP